ncbi:hypothetical protein BH23CHL5_BH23CHL5_25530 [soil metagenome]
MIRDITRTDGAGEEHYNATPSRYASIRPCGHERSGVRSALDDVISFYIDADEWVVLPNVIGMGLNADGGVTATKPYIASGA